MIDPFATGRVLRLVHEERQAQDQKWGQQNHGLDRWLTILTEEVGEFAMAVLEQQWHEARAEMLQVAAVAAAIVECMDRKGEENGWNHE